MSPQLFKSINTIEDNASTSFVKLIYPCCPSSLSSLSLPLPGFHRTPFFIFYFFFIFLAHSSLPLSTDIIYHHHPSCHITSSLLNDGRKPDMPSQVCEAARKRTGAKSLDRGLWQRAYLTPMF